MSVNPEDWDVDFAFPDFNLALFECERSWCRNWIVTFTWKNIWSVFKILTQITLEDENELADIREVFPKKLRSESFDNDNKLTLKSSLLCAVCVCVFFYKDQRRKDGNDFEKDTVPGFQSTPALH